MKNFDNVNTPSDYHIGYSDAVSDTLTDREVKAFYAGVGYGKAQANENYLGFNSDLERENFELGIKYRDRHFNAFRGKRITFWDRLFGKSDKPKKINVGRKSRSRKKTASRGSHNQHKRSRKSGKRYYGNNSSRVKNTKHSWKRRA